MSNELDPVLVRRFRPERPIYLNEGVLGVSTRSDVNKAIVTLRSQGWLVCYGPPAGEPVLPIHMSFDDSIEFKKFEGVLEPLQVIKVAVKGSKKDDKAEFDSLGASTLVEGSKTEAEEKFIQGKAKKA